MFSSFTSAFICFRAILNRFSIGLRSGDLAGITCMFALAESKASFAFADVCDGSLSMANNRESFLPFPVISNKIGNFCLINLAKYAPDIFSYGSAQITPCPYDIATNKCRRFPPASSLLPFVLIVNLRSSFSRFDLLASSHHFMGCLYTQTTLHPNKTQSLLSNNHLRRFSCKLFPFLQILFHEYTFSATVVIAISKCSYIP